MASRIELVCAHAGLRSDLQSWLDRGALAPSTPLTLDVSVGAPPDLSGDSRAVFTQPTVEIRSGPPDDTVVIGWQNAPAVATLAPFSSRAVVVLSPEARDRLEECASTFLMTVLIFLLRRAGWHHVHAATAVDPAGRGWLVAGDAHCGKSTTAALLASAGWQVGTDDTAFLAANGTGVKVLALHAPIALRRGGYELLGRPGGELLARRGKMAFWPEELGGRWAPEVQPEIMIFPSIGGDRSSSEPLSAAGALVELVRWSAWVVLEPDLAQAHLDLLTRLAGQARSYRVSLGRDLFLDPALLGRLAA